MSKQSQLKSRQLAKTSAAKYHAGPHPKAKGGRAGGPSVLSPRSRAIIARTKAALESKAIPVWCLPDQETP